MIVVPVATLPQRARGPTAVALPGGAGGLVSASTALCHRVTTLDRSKLDRRLGTLGAEEMEGVVRGLAAALDLP